MKHVPAFAGPLTSVVLAACDLLGVETVMEPHDDCRDFGGDAIVTFESPS